MLPTGAGVGKVLTSDASGNGTWEGAPTENSVATAYRSAAQKIPNAAWTQIKLDKAINDPGSNISIAKGCYVVPADGYYQISGSVKILGLKANLLFISGIFLNGAEAITGVQSNLSVETDAAGPVVGILFCKKGEEIELRIYQASTIEKELAVGASTCRLNVARVGAGPAGATGPEGPTLGTTTVAMAYRKVKQKIPDAAYTTVKLDTEQNDPGKNMNLTSGVYVAPADGYYQVSGNVYMTLATNTDAYSAIYVNGTKVIIGSESLSTGLAEATSSSVSGVVFAKKGEEIELKAYQHNTVAKEQETIVDASANRLSVVRVA